MIKVFYLVTGLISGIMERKSVEIFFIAVLHHNFQKLQQILSKIQIL
jgi:hypothetical protein